MEALAALGRMFYVSRIFTFREIVKSAPTHKSGHIVADTAAASQKTSFLTDIKAHFPVYKV